MTAGNSRDQGSGDGADSSGRTAPFVPPRWVVHAAWGIHRALDLITAGRLGVRRPTSAHWGMMRLRTVGRRTGAARVAILAYFEDGGDLVTMAMNGWGGPEPAWWLNLQAHPDATVELPGGTRMVHARAAVGDERRRLWERWAHYTRNLDRYAALRPRETAVVILEPAPGTESADSRA